MINPFFHDLCPTDTVAFCDGRLISRQLFLCDLAGAVQRLHPYAGKNGLLLTEDAYWGAVGLLAMAQAGIAVIMPPNGQSATLEALAGAFDIIVCDGEIATMPSTQSHKIVLDHANASALPGLAEFDPAAPISFFTSGSSSTRKQCGKTLAHVVAEAWAIESLLGSEIPRDCAVFGTVSHQHAYGFAFRMLWPLLSGRPIIGRMYKFVESLFHDLNQPALVVSSPAHLSRLDGITALPEAKRPHVILSAGGHLEDTSAETARHVFGVTVTDIYGSTEAGAMAFRVRSGTNDLWQPMPGTIITPSAEGELRAQSPHIPPEGEINADRIEMRDNGRFTLLGRSDRVAKIEGKRISLSEVERLLTGMAEVENAVVITFEKSEGLGAIIVPSTEGKDVLQQLGPFRFGRTLRASLGQWIDPAGLPRRWRFLTELPPGDMGKTSRADLARHFEAESK